MRALTATTKKALNRTLALAVAPFVLILMVTMSLASPASAATPRHSPSYVSNGLPSIWSLKCNILTLGKFGINPITGQIYRCEYDEDLGGYLWLPVYICPNTAVNGAVDGKEPSAVKC